MYSFKEETFMTELRDISSITPKVSNLILFYRFHLFTVSYTFPYQMEPTVMAFCAEFQEVAVSFFAQGRISSSSSGMEAISPER